jgi:exosortase
MPAMIAASYVWGHGEYYDYGWFVPPMAAWLTYRRWQETEGPVRLPQRGWVIAAVGLLVPWILILRVLGNADPSWRMPISLLGVTAAFFSYGLIVVSRGWRVSAGFAWITLLWFSAIPWPSVIESRIVHHLTQSVVMVAAEIFQFGGKPVEILGDRLRLYQITVEVTDGCSGVRSFQSFVMATWFFAELQRLSASRGLVLLLFACGGAFLVNMGRTYGLAWIRFEWGEESFHRMHDPMGLLAFLVSGVFFFVVSGKLSNHPRRRVVRVVKAG